MNDKSDLDIALVGPAFPYRGGIAHFIERLQDGFSARGFRSRIFTFTRQYPELLFPGKSQLTSGEPPEPPPTRCLDTLNPVTWLSTARAIARSAPGVVVLKYWMPFFAPAFGTVARRVRKRGSRVVVVVDNVLPHERRPGDVALTKYFLKAVDGFVVMSSKVREDLEMLVSPAEVRLVEHPTYDNFGVGVPRQEARMQLGIPVDAHVLLFFGFVRKYKGLETLLSAMPTLTEADPKIHLVVAGEFYDDEREYRGQIAKLGISSKLTLMSEYIADEDVATVFSAADVVVQPYLSATQSGVAQIAFNFDRPVITTDVGGLAETVTHGTTGLVVAPGSPGALAEAVRSFFDEDLGKEMSAAVSREKARFGWEAMYDAITELGRLTPPQPATDR